jgi:hypothetical protein
MNIFVIIVILGIILLILLMLNNITVINPPTTTTTATSTEQGNCAQTTFGCCPDGVNSKINYNGTNCPVYNPGAGYSTTNPNANVVVVT